MSKSFDVKVSFNCRATVSDEDLQEILKDLEEYRSGKGCAPNPLGDASVKAFDEQGEDGLLIFTLKTLMKELREGFLRETKGGDLHHVSPFHAEITPRG